MHKLSGIFRIIVHGFAIQVLAVIPDNGLPGICRTDCIGNTGRIVFRSHNIEFIGADQGPGGRPVQAKLLW